MGRALASKGEKPRKCRIRIGLSDSRNSCWCWQCAEVRTRRGRRAGVEGKGEIRDRAGRYQITFIDAEKSFNRMNKDNVVVVTLRARVVDERLFLTRREAQWHEPPD